jgi:hypothetical protein
MDLISGELDSELASFFKEHLKILKNIFTLRAFRYDDLVLFEVPKYRLRFNLLCGAQLEIACTSMEIVANAFRHIQSNLDSLGSGPVAEQISESRLHPTSIRPDPALSSAHPNSDIQQVNSDAGANLNPAVLNEVSTQVPSSSENSPNALSNSDIQEINSGLRATSKPSESNDVTIQVPSSSENSPVESSSNLNSFGTHPNVAHDSNSVP